MLRCWRFLIGLHVVAAVLSVHQNPLQAQAEVAVTPDGASAGTMPSNTGGYTAVFLVRNNSSDPDGTDTYNMSCVGNILTTCTSITPSFATLPPGYQTTVTVTYSVGAYAGAGKVRLRAMSPTTEFGDAGYYDLTVTGPLPPAAPLVSTTPTNSTFMSMAACASACFAAVYTHSTPSYTSLDVARSFGLVYNSSTHVPVPVVQVDVTKPASTATPTAYSIQLKKSDGTFITLHNGATIAYFAVPGSFPGRLTAAFSSQANGLGTGAWDLTAVVTAYFSAGPLTTNTQVRVLVNDQSKSQFGAGVGMAGLQQVRFLPGSSSVVITEGDGSIAYYSRSTSTSPFITPSGASDTLVFTGSVYRRYALDSSYVEFNSAGNMTKAVDRHGNTTVITRFTLDSVPRRITDPMGKYIELCFGDTGLCYTGKLLRARVLTGTAVRENNYLANAGGQLIRILDPDGFSDSLAYGANGLLTTVWDRARQRHDYTFDAMLRLSQVQAPSVTLWDGTAVRPATSMVTSESVAWQPGTPGTTQGAPKAAIKGDTVRARITDPLGSTITLKVDRFGAPLKIVDPYGATTTITRDANGRPTDVLGPDGHLTHFTYTGYVVTQSSDNTTGHTLNYTYRPGSNYLLKVSGNTVRKDFIYTASNGGSHRALSKVYINSTGAPGTAVNAQLVSWHKPDMMGRDTAIVDSLGYGTHYVYESTWGNVQTTKDAALQDVTVVTYDDRGRTVRIKNSLSGSDTLTYGVMNQVTWRRSGLGLATSYGHNPATLLLTQVTDPKGQVNNFAYNALGALTKQYAVGSATAAESLGYDAAGRAVRIWNRDVAPIVMTYDKIGRPLSRAVPGAPTDFFVYDTLSAHWLVAYNANARDSVYTDLPARKSFTSTTIGNRTYTATDSLNQSGQSTGYVIRDLSSLYYQTVTTKYSGSGLADTLCIANQCMWIQRAGNMTTNLVTYDSASSLLRRWNMTQTTDPSRRVVEQNFVPTALAPFDIVWQRDSLGRVKSRAKHDGTRTLDYGYDLDGQLVKACEPSLPPCPPTPRWSYDAAGNRAENGIVTQYGFDNRLLSRGPEAFQYDSNQNLQCRYPIGQSCTSGLAGRRYTYDALGRLTAVQNLATQVVIASYGYDAFDRRVIRRISGTTPLTEIYIHHGSQVVMDIDSTTGLRRAEYVWVPGAADLLFAMRNWNSSWGSDWHAAITDPNNGTVRGIVRFGGNAVVKRYAEEPWGDTAADTNGNRFRFAGASLEPETGLYYMRARFYDPLLGRFLTEDPIGIAGGLNLFAYASGDPINRSDPSGLDDRCPPGQKPALDDPNKCAYVLPELPSENPWPFGPNPEPPSNRPCVIACGGTSAFPEPSYLIPPGHYPTIGPGSGPPKRYGEEVWTPKPSECTVAVVSELVAGVADAVTVVSLISLQPEIAVGVRSAAIGVQALVATRGLYGMRQLSMGAGIVGYNTAQVLGLTGGAGPAQTLFDGTDLRNASYMYQTHGWIAEACK